MAFVKFDLHVMERELTLQNYERVSPEAEKLLEAGYPPERVAALMFQYGYVFGRKLLKDCQKERRIRKAEAMRQVKAEAKTESQTSGKNEGSIEA